MKQGARRSNASGGIEQAIAAAAGPPPLIAGEKAPAYEEMLARVADAVKASDMLEHMWVRDVVDLAWEVFRLRRHKVNLMAAARFEGMKQLHRSWCGSDADRGLGLGKAPRRGSAHAGRDRARQGRPHRGSRGGVYLRDAHRRLRAHRASDRGAGGAPQRRPARARPAPLEPGAAPAPRPAGARGRRGGGRGAGAACGRARA